MLKISKIFEFPVNHCPVKLVLCNLVRIIVRGNQLLTRFLPVSSMKTASKIEDSERNSVWQFVRMAICMGGNLSGW